MSRTLTITRPQQSIIKVGNLKWMVRLNNEAAGYIENGQTVTFPISEQSQQIEILLVNFLGKSPAGTEPAKAVIQSGNLDCKATVHASMGLWGTKLNFACTYDAPVLSESTFIDNVTEFMVTVFNGPGIMERVNDPNNRRKDIRIICSDKGIHLRWQLASTKGLDQWSKGWEEEIIPYTAAGSVPPFELTQERLDKIERTIVHEIAQKTKFGINEYGALAIINKRTSLY